MEITDPVCTSMAFVPIYNFINKKCTYLKGGQSEATGD